MVCLASWSEMRRMEAFDDGGYSRYVMSVGVGVIRVDYMWAWGGGGCGVAGWLSRVIEIVIVIRNFILMAVFMLILCFCPPFLVFQNLFLFLFLIFFSFLKCTFTYIFVPRFRFSLFSHSGPAVSLVYILGLLGYWGVNVFCFVFFSSPFYLFIFVFSSSYLIFSLCSLYCIAAFGVRTPPTSNLRHAFEKL
ncbi:hypothetical protein BDZ91DRAFT_80240 [Kalaharituber pfeilii]|nr:hypothetical protein BDZ91DRAFT_80240 [Kalaharituber pfeilii]